MKISKKNKAKRITEFCSRLTYQDRVNYNKEGDKAFLFVPELCEILDGITADQIVKQVGDMSVNQWDNYLQLTLAQVTEQGKDDKLERVLGLFVEALADLVDNREEELVAWYKARLNEILKQGGTNGKKH
jgi:hypothetical protein